MDNGIDEVPSTTPAFRTELAEQLAELVPEAIADGGDYNPDWAIIKQEDGEDRIYMIRETKSTSDPKKIRPSEQAKIDCGEKHFAAIGVHDFAKSSPGNWNL